jgi:hypothetical protein
MERVIYLDQNKKRRRYINNLGLLWTGSASKAINVTHAKYFLLKRKPLG